MIKYRIWIGVVWLVLSIHGSWAQEEDILDPEDRQEVDEDAPPREPVHAFLCTDT